MQLIILSAGIGSRLRPFTNDKPKCLVKVGGKPILQRQLEISKLCGINKKSISIVGGYFCDQLRKYNLNLFMLMQQLTGITVIWHELKFV